MLAVPHNGFVRQARQTFPQLAAVETGRLLFRDLTTSQGCSVESWGSNLGQWSHLLQSLLGTKYSPTVAGGGIWNWLASAEGEKKTQEHQGTEAGNEWQAEPSTSCARDACEVSGVSAPPSDLEFFLKRC